MITGADESDRATRKSTRAVSTKGQSTTPQQMPETEGPTKTDEDETADGFDFLSASNQSQNIPLFIYLFIFILLSKTQNILYLRFLTKKDESTVAANG